MTFATPAPPVFAMPGELARAGYAIRAECEDDVPFLARLYAATRADALGAATGWNETQKAAFVGHQFHAQRTHYRTHFPAAAFLVIERAAVPVGRLYLERRGDTYHIIDIALLPDLRGHGVGTALLGAVIAQAAAAGLGVGLFVERFNPALRLYRRFGFIEIGDTGVYLEMRRDTARAA